ISRVWFAVVMLIALAEVAVPVNLRSDADAEERERVVQVLTGPLRVSVPALAVIVTAPESAAVTVPRPLRVAPLPTALPEPSVSLPPETRMVPLVMPAAGLLVSSPPLPISSVWFAVVMLIALAEVAVPVNLRSDADA